MEMDEKKYKVHHDHDVWLALIVSESEETYLDSASLFPSAIKKAAA